MTRTSGIRKKQPRLRYNDYTALPVPQIGEWEPELDISVVVPALEDQEKLDIMLAGLSAQTYPSRLTEVVIVDDGSSTLRLPELSPERARIIPSAPGGWGSAHAVRTGVAAAEGDVVLRLDADMLVHREHLEAHMRWHHLADYLVVIGDLRIVDFVPGELRAVAAHKAVADGTAKDLFEPERAFASWTAQVIDETDGLLEAGSRAYRVASGATISFTPRLYRECGGLDPTLVLGGDLEFGYRLAQAGAVFVPERQARSWHLGIPQMKGQHEEGMRFREPFLSQRIPHRRDWRRETGRQWRVPYVDVVVDAEGGSYEEVRATVAGALASTLPDVGITIVGPWSRLTRERRAPLNDPLLDLRLVHEAFIHDGRVELTESHPMTSAPVPFRFVCPAGLVPTSDALNRLIELANDGRYGMVLLAFPKGSELQIAKLERTEAVSRARALCEADEEITEIVHEIFGIHWIDGAEWALVSAAKAPGPVSPAEAGKWHKEATRWKSQAARWKKEAERLEKEAEQWKENAARLEQRVHDSLGAKFRVRMTRRALRLRTTHGSAGRDA